jgi:NAD(P)-dependent dehydrogenase (short-subunit alcohol dehydrogenase family)
MKDKVALVMGADAVVFLCSGESSFITGHDLVVDGSILVRSNVVAV